MSATSKWSSTPSTPPRWRRSPGPWVDVDGFDKRSGETDNTGIADQITNPPDYELERVLYLDDPAQLKALFNQTRLDIVSMLSERAATTSQLADALDMPKGTVGHHVKVLERAGLVQVVRTEMVRAIEAKYYGRTARTFDISPVAGEASQDNLVLATAFRELAEVERLHEESESAGVTAVRYARISEERAREWQERLIALIDEFTTTPRGGDRVYGLMVALYPTVRPHL